MPSRMACLARQHYSLVSNLPVEDGKRKSSVSVEESVSERPRQPVSVDAAVDASVALSRFKETAQYDFQGDGVVC